MQHKKFYLYLSFISSRRFLEIIPIPSEKFLFSLPLTKISFSKTILREESSVHLFKEKGSELEKH